MNHIFQQQKTDTITFCLIKKYKLILTQPVKLQRLIEPNSESITMQTKYS